MSETRIFLRVIGLAEEYTRRTGEDMTPAIVALRREMNVAQERRRFAFAWDEAAAAYVVGEIGKPLRHWYSRTLGVRLIRLALHRPGRPVTADELSKLWGAAPSASQVCGVLARARENIGSVCSALATELTAVRYEAGAVIYASDTEIIVNRELISNINTR